MSDPKISQATPNATGSPALESGQPHSDSQESPTTTPAGPEAAPASHSPPLVSARDSPTSATCGLSGGSLSLPVAQAWSGESRSGRLSQSARSDAPLSSMSSETFSLAIAARLKLKSQTLGSTMYSLRWKRHYTPLGRLVPLLRASALPIKDTEPTSLESPWATPTARDFKDGSSPAVHEATDRLPGQVLLAGYPTPTLQDDNQSRMSAEAMQRERDRPSSGTNLAHVAELTGWPSPCQQDGPKGGPAQGTDRLPGAADLAGWQTPKLPSAGGQEQRPTDGGGLRKLEDQALLSGWTTPQVTEPDADPRPSREATGRKTEYLGRMVKLVGPARLTDSGEMLTGLAAGMPSGGQLNPRHSLWLMLGPLGIAWLSCAELATRSVSRKRKTSSKP